MLAVDQAVIPPGMCVFCMAAQGPFVDTLRDDDDPRVVVGPNQIGFGIINHWYICAGCISSMMQLVAPKIGQKVVNLSAVESDLAQFQQVCDRLRAAEARADAAEGALRVVNALTASDPEPVDEEARAAHPTARPRATPKARTR